MEVVCKVVAVFLNRWPKASTTFHNVLHGFRAGSRTGNAILEVKLLHQLVAMSKEVLYVIFLDLSK